MAAEAAISFAVEKLGNLLIQKVNFLIDVEEKVQKLKDELENMKSFLKDAAEKQGGDERISKWISDIREVALDAEDAIEIFILKVENTRRSRGLLKRCACFPVHVSHINTVGEEIESITARLQDIDERRERYQIQNLGDGSGSSRITRSENAEWRRRFAYKQNDKHLVGLEKDVKFLLRNEILDKEKKGLSVAAIVGMGGSGKSTLARRLYNHDAIANQFECHASVVVSSDFQLADIIKQIMIQLQQNSTNVLETTKKMEESITNKLALQEMLQQMLHKQLEGKQYFIVVDDVWENTHWESLKNAFPNEKDKTSRLLLTSRNQQIIPPQDGYIHTMRLLERHESWELLLKTAFPDKTDGKCPQDLVSIGEEIVTKCGGLPLAIAVAGGLLVNQGERESMRGWEKVLKQLKNSDSETSEIGKNVSAILELSYQNLPPQLKACFMCLSFFKEDATIDAKSLIHIWVAQGFTSLEKVGGEETMEDIARDYLDELIKRNLIQVKHTSTNYRVKDCYVHDLLRDLSIKKAKEEIGFERTSEVGSSSMPSHKSRHCVVLCRGEGLMIGSPSQNKHIRSLFLLADGKKKVNLGTRSYWKSFELLRTLDIEGSLLVSTFPEMFRGLIGLRYLRIRYAPFQLIELPSWLEHLKNLEVLDLTDGKISLPNVIWKMDSLRHFYARDIIGPVEILVSTWKKLETLKYINPNINSNNVATHMASCRLRKLGLVFDISIESIDCYVNSLEKMENLVRLHIKWEMHSKTKDPMPVLGKLPKLLSLKLNGVHEISIKGMTVLPDGFPKLQALSLKWMNDLHWINIEEGGMPQLQRLLIRYCPSLKIEDLPKRIRSVAITTTD